MRRLLTGTAIAALALALTASAQAGPGRHSGGTSHYSTPANYSSKYSPSYSSKYFNTGHFQTYSAPKFTGQRFGNYYRFYGQYGHYWSRTCWSRKCGCYCYWCPTTCCWYYWCAPQDCYYPTSYIAYAPLVRAARPPVRRPRRCRPRALRRV